MSSEEALDSDSPSGVVVVPKNEEDDERGLSIFQREDVSFIYHWDNINVFSRSPPHDFNRTMHTAGQPPPPKKKLLGGTPCNHILRNVSGFIRPGQLYALMGASGAGKTTLLNVLHFNVKKLHVEGDRCMNGNPVDSEYISNISAYVQQEDLFIPSVTVREHLAFTARLRMDKNMTHAQRMKKVDQTIRLLGLTKCQNSRIGDPALTKGISGGEMKRLAFAAEYLSDPSILFCDEPTSGLDAFMAQSVVEVMQKMAARGKAIICTIHQPASEVFEMFDHIYLLSAGRVAYSGTISEAIDFFSSQGYVCPKNHNPADYFIFTLAVMPGDEEQCKKRTDEIVGAYILSSRHAEIETIVKYRADTPVGSFKHDIVGNKKKKKCCHGAHYRASWYTQFDSLLRRNLTVEFREPQLFFARILQVIFIGFVIGGVFYHQANDQHGTKNICAVLFLLVINISVLAMFGVVFVFILELPIFLRENWNNMYRSDSYFLAKTISELPFVTMYSIILMAIVYYMTGLYPSTYRFIMACVILSMVAHISSSFGYFMSVMCPNITSALVIVPTVTTPFWLFSGFFIRDDPKFIWWDYPKYLSWYFYGAELLNVNQWQDVKMLVPDDHANEENTTLLFLGDGSAVLIFFNFEEKFWRRDFFIMALMVVVLRIMAYLALAVKASARR